MSIVAALAFCVLMVALAILQFALIVGAPIGNLAWGGQHRVLRAGKRVGSGISIVLYAVFAAIVLQRAGLVALIPVQAVVDIGIWVIFGYLIIGIAMNALSRSVAERWTMAPLCLVLAALTLTVALG